MGIKQYSVKSSKTHEKEYGSYFQMNLKDYTEKETAKKASWREVWDRRTVGSCNGSISQDCSNNKQDPGQNYSEVSIQNSLYTIKCASWNLNSKPTSLSQLLWKRLPSAYFRSTVLDLSFFAY